MRKTIYLVLLLACMQIPLTASAEITWNIIDKQMANWNGNDGEAYNKAWSLSKPGNVPASVVTQQDGYVNITKTQVGANQSNYAFLVPPAMTNITSDNAYTIEVRARVNPLDKTQFPDLEDGGFEANHISARMNGKVFGIYIKHGIEDGYISLTPAIKHAEEDKHTLNTAEWHNYRFVLHAGSASFDVYIDDEEKPVWENIAATPMSGTNILRLGAETNQRCNMDIEYAKVGSGDTQSGAKFLSIDIPADSHVENTKERQLKVTVNTTLVPDGEKITIAFTDKDGKELIKAVEASIVSNKTSRNITIPANLPAGTYYIQAAALNGKFGDAEATPLTMRYDIVKPSPFDEQLLPQVSPVSFVREIGDYQYIGPSKEFIFPCILDTKTSTTEGRFANGDAVLDRYYLFYTPHEVPGGMYLATAPTLEGPWTERNTVIDVNWARKVTGSNVSTADHISSCQVVWNEVQRKYIMYFHGPNSTTHYAISDNLKDWTFGKSILNPQSFGSTGSEASYAKVFEHNIPGLNNKYILLLMINESGTRKIFWAHSQDGIEWNCIKKPLVSPNLGYKKIPGTLTKPNYSGGFGNNVSGPFFMESGGRYFVFCNGSSGHIFVVEVGESLDMEIHWGEYMKQSDVIIDTDESGQKAAVPRIAAPYFIQDDQNHWYMFFEAGGRLGANIAFAKENKQTGIGNNSSSVETVRLFPNPLKSGQRVSVELPSETLSNGTVEIINLSGESVYRNPFSDCNISLQAPALSGTYIVRISNVDGVSLKSKLIVL